MLRTIDVLYKPSVKKWIQAIPKDSTMDESPQPTEKMIDGIFFLLIKFE
jgi:hypothetical protein